MLQALAGVSAATETPADATRNYIMSLVEKDIGTVKPQISSASAATATIESAPARVGNTPNNGVVSPVSLAKILRKVAENKAGNNN